TGAFAARPTTGSRRPAARRGAAPVPARAPAVASEVEEEPAARGERAEAEDDGELAGMKHDVSWEVAAQRRPPIAAPPGSPTRPAHGAAAAGGFLPTTIMVTPAPRPTAPTAHATALIGVSVLPRCAASYPSWLQAAGFGQPATTAA